MKLIVGVLVYILGQYWYSKLEDIFIWFLNL